MFRKLLIIALLMCAGCASQLNQRHVVFYTEAGSQAEDARDWKMAEQNYERALINANHAFVSDHYKSMAMYNLGRIKGYRCKFGEAEKLLTDALTLEEKISGPQSGITTMRLFELARMHFDRNQYVQAIPYFSRALKTAVVLQVAESDPLALAASFEDYATALRESGKPLEAEKAMSRAARLRLGQEGKVAHFIPKRYNQGCSGR